MLYHYKLELFQKITGNSIGFIEYYYDNKTKSVDISFLIIKDEFQGIGYGSLLLILLLNDLLNLKKEIQIILLENSSDRKENSIYHKFGFKQTAANEAEMAVLFKDDIKDVILFKDLDDYELDKYKTIDKYENLESFIKKNIYGDRLSDLITNINSEYVIKKTIIKEDDVSKVRKVNFGSKISKMLTRSIIEKYRKSHKYGTRTKGTKVADKTGGNNIKYNSLNIKIYNKNLKLTTLYTCTDGKIYVKNNNKFIRYL
jgi:hypothetical protein